MTVIKLQAASAKPDLKVEYKKKTYILPGEVRGDVLEALVGAGSDELQLTKVFLEFIVPNDFKKVLGQADIAQLVQIWNDYIQVPKESLSNE